jgi:transposase
MMREFYLGIDVSKGYADFIIINEGKNIVMDNFQLDDTAYGHEQLAKVLKEFTERESGCFIYAAVESTGGYENNWFNALLNLDDMPNIHVARVNPFGTSHNSKASMSRVITDKNAARNIAEYLVNHKEKIIYSKEDKFFPLRRQWKFVRMLTKQKTQLYNQLESVLYTANPEILVYCRHGCPNWLLEVLLHYPTAKRLSRARVTGLTAIAYVSEQRAVSLISKAKKSVASAGDTITANLVASLVKQIMDLTKKVEKQSKFIADNCNLPEVEILKSFKGIGDYSAVGLLLNIHPTENFTTTKKLASFSGVHPVWKQSGDGTFGMHMSKQGRVEIRSLLYMVTKTAIVHNELIREIYARHLHKGMNKAAAMGALMHKILRIIYGMLKNNEKFNPEKDRVNSQKMLKGKSSVKAAVNKLRRYQSPDHAAPISRRQAKKRKEQEKSQNEITSLSTGSIPRSS